MEPTTFTSLDFRWSEQSNGKSSEKTRQRAKQELTGWSRVKALNEKLGKYIKLCQGEMLQCKDTITDEVLIYM